MAKGLRDPIQRDNAILDACTRALVQADERAPGCDGELLNFGHLLAVHLTQCATENSAVLGENTHFPAVYRARSSDDAVGDRALGLHPKIMGAVACELISFNK